MTHIVVDDFTRVNAEVTNGGDGPAYDLLLTLSGPPVGDAQGTEPDADESVSWHLPIKPTAVGSVPLSWELTFDDLNGVGQKLAGTEYV